jgi:hypothetical protein
VSLLMFHEENLSQSSLMISVVLNLRSFQVSSRPASSVSSYFPFTTLVFFSMSAANTEEF